MGEQTLEIFGLELFQRALIGGLLIGFVAPLIGVFVVLRRLSLIGDTLAHVSIAGVALGFLLNLFPLAFGVGFALVGAFAIEKLRRTYKSYAELSIAIIMSSGIALASLFFTMGRGFNMNVYSFLFGSILTLNEADLWVVFTLTVIVAIVVFVLLKELFMVTFDEDTASVSGLPLGLLNMILTILTALIVSAAIKIVGALLVSALLTVPVATSLYVAKSFRQTIGYAILFGEIAVIGGLVVAGLLDLAPGGTIVLLAIAMLIITLISRKWVKA